MPSSFHAFVFFILCASLAHRLSIILVPSCTLDMLANPVPTALRWGTPMFKWIYVQLSDGGERGVWWCNWCLCLVALPIKCIPEALFWKLSAFRAPFVSRGLTDDFFFVVFWMGECIPQACLVFWKTHLWGQHKERAGGRGQEYSDFSALHSSQSADNPFHIHLFQFSLYLD